MTPEPVILNIEFNYGQIEGDTGSASGGISAAAGYSAGTGVTGSFFEISGSRVTGSFLDSSASTGLVFTSNIGNPGRYVFEVREGAVVDMIDGDEFTVFVPDFSALDLSVAAGETIAASAFGAVADSNAFNASTIVNFGAISTINNDGTIDGRIHSNNYLQLTNGGNINGTVNMGFGTIDNSGTIDALASPDGQDQQLSSFDGVGIYSQITGDSLTDNYPDLDSDAQPFSLNNAAGGSITGETGVLVNSFDSTPVSITNAGTITGTVGPSVSVAGGPLTLDNSGTITGQNDAGIRPLNGGTITNSAGGVISGTGSEGQGVEIFGGGSVMNDGTITANEQAGVAVHGDG